MSIAREIGENYTLADCCVLKMQLMHAPDNISNSQIFPVSCPELPLWKQTRRSAFGHVRLVLHAVRPTGSVPNFPLFSLYEMTTG